MRGSLVVSFAVVLVILAWTAGAAAASPPLQGPAALGQELAIGGVRFAVLGWSQPAQGWSKAQPDAEPVGQAARTGDISVFVAGWDEVADDPEQPLDPGTKWVRVEIVAANHGAAAVDFCPRDRLRLRDASGAEQEPDKRFHFSPATAAYACAPLAPGLPLRGAARFMVPRDARGWTLVYVNDQEKNPAGDNMFVALGPEPVAVEPPAELVAASIGPAGEVGRPQRRGDWTLVVFGWGLLPAPEGVQVKPGSQVLMVDLAVTNEGTGLLHVDPFTGASLRDGAARQYTFLRNWYGRPNITWPFRPALSPGETQRAALVFEVPANAADVKGWLFGLKPSAPQEEELLVALGDEPRMADVVALMPPVSRNLHRVGETVRYRDVELLVNGWAPLDVSGVTPGPNVRWLAVDVTLKNAGPDMRFRGTFEPFTLRDAYGRSFDRQASVQVVGGTGLEFGRGLAPGEQMRGQVPFAVYANATGLVLACDLSPEFPGEGETLFVALGETPAAATPPTAAPPGQDGPSGRRPGEVVSANGLDLVVLGWETVPPQPGGFYRLDEGRQWLFVDLLLANRGGEPRELGSRLMALADAAGGLYRTNMAPLLDTGTELSGFTLVPGEWVRTRVPFDVPAATDGFVFSFTFPGPGGDVSGEQRAFFPLTGQPARVEPPDAFVREPLPPSPLGQEVEADGWAVTVQPVPWVKTQYGEPREGWQFVVVEVTLRNTTADELHLNDSDQFRLYDGDGSWHVPDAGATGPSTHEAFGKDLPAGAAVTGRIGFEVPLDARGLQFVFKTADGWAMTVQGRVPRKLCFPLPAELPPVPAEAAPVLSGSSGGVTLTVLDVGTYEGSDELRPQPGHKFWTVPVRIENGTEASLRVPPVGSLVLRDAAGLEVECGPQIWAALGERLPLTDPIRPGEQTTVALWFEVPDAGAGWRLVLKLDRASSDAGPLSGEVSADLP